MFPSLASTILSLTDPSCDRALSTVSLNIARETDSAKVVSAIRNTPQLRDADIFLFQEVPHDDGNSSVADETARRLGYFASFAAAPDACNQGLAVVSRYPVDDIQIKHLKQCDLRFRRRNRFALSTTVQTPWGSLRIWNVHLDTRINAEERLAQLWPVIHDAARQTGPRLIGGDFNTNDLYWLGNMLPLPGGRSHSHTIRSAMEEYGFETPLPSGLHTFPVFRRHLDWIFFSELRSSAVGLQPVPFSDHNAICVRVHL